jgi:hypothetical protein
MTEQEQMPLFGPDPVRRDFGRDDERAHARRDDPDTSKRAAASIGSNQLRARNKRAHGLLVKHGPMARFQLIECFGDAGYKDSPEGVRTAVSWLIDHGRAQETGRETKTPRGRMAGIVEAIA